MDEEVALRVDATSGTLAPPDAGLPARRGCCCGRDKDTPLQTAFNYRAYTDVIETHLVEVLKHLRSKFVNSFNKFVGYFLSHAFELLKGSLLARY